MRLFAGIKLDDPWHDTLDVLKDSVISADPGWAGAKWVGKGNHHVTLGFFGEVPENAVEDLRNGLAETAMRHTPFELPLDRAVWAVPSPARARMLWATLLDPDGAGAALAADIQQATAFLGRQPEVRAYRPHITLARARRPMPVSMDELNTGACLGSLGESQVVSVPGYTLFSSRLGRAGAVYDAIAEFELRY